MHKLGMQQMVKIAKQAGACRHIRMQNRNEDKASIPIYLTSSTNKTSMPDFHSSDKEAGKKTSETITNKIHNEFNYFNFSQEQNPNL